MPNDILDFHRSELLHINSTLERSAFTKRETARWHRRRRLHERTIQEVTSLRKDATLYEELRREIDGGSESMTHDDAIDYVRWLKRKASEKAKEGGNEYGF